MKNTFAIAIGVAALLTTGMLFAQDAKHAAAGPGAPMATGSPMGQMDECMTNMHALHEKMAGAATPEERQQLMADQRDAMQKGMATMHGMDHGGAPMGGPGTGMTGADGKPLDQKTRMQMMERRMDMMQAMMQTMMDQQATSSSPMMPMPAK